MTRADQNQVVALDKGYGSRGGNSLYEEDLRDLGGIERLEFCPEILVGEVRVICEDLDRNEQ